MGADYREKRNHPAFMGDGYREKQRMGMTRGSPAANPNESQTVKLRIPTPGTHPSPRRVPLLLPLQDERLGLLVIDDFQVLRSRVRPVKDFCVLDNLLTPALRTLSACRIRKPPEGAKAYSPGSERRQARRPRVKSPQFFPSPRGATGISHGSSSIAKGSRTLAPRHAKHRGRRAAAPSGLGKQLSSPLPGVAAPL